MIFAGIFAVILMFAALARGAHDLWSASLVHAATLGCAAALIVSTYRKSGARLRLPLGLPVTLFAAAVLLSAVLAANRFEAIFAVKDLAAILIFFFAGASLFETDDDIDLLLSICVPVLWIEASLMVFQLINVIPSYENEAYGTLVNPNIQAAFALFWVPPLLFRAHARRAEKKAWLYLGSGALAAVAVIFLAGSTWGVLCLGLAVMVAVAVRVNRPAFTWGLGALALALVAGAVWYKFVRTVNWQWGAEIPAPQGSDRLYWWKSAAQMFVAHPVFGVGPGGFASAYPAYKAGTGQSTLFAHSLPLTVLSELGLAGGAAVAALLFAWIRRVTRRLSLRGAFAVGVLLVVTMSLVNIGSEYLVNRLAMALFAGIALGAVKAKEWRPRFSAAVLAPALAVLALPLLVSPFLAGRFLTDGKERLAAGDVAGAQKQFESAVSLDGSWWEARHGLALARWAAGAEGTESRALAIFDIERAIALNRLNGALWMEKGLMLRDAGRLEEARQSLLEALRLRPSDKRIPDELGKLGDEKPASAAGS